MRRTIPSPTSRGSTLKCPLSVFGFFFLFFFRYIRFAIVVVAAESSTSFMRTVKVKRENANAIAQCYTHSPPHTRLLLRLVGLVRLVLVRRLLGGRARTFPYNHPVLTQLLKI